MSRARKSFSTRPSPRRLVDTQPTTGKEVMTDMPHEQPEQTHRPPESRPTQQDAVRLRFLDLAGGRPEVQIEHRGQIYRLRVTRNGKLILNK